MLIVLHLLLEGVDGRSVCLEPLVDGGTHAGADQKERHPEVGHEHVDDDHDAELVVLSLCNLLEGSLVGSAADPAAGNRGEAAPQGIGGVPPENVGSNLADQPQGHGSPYDDAQRGGEEHDERLGAEVQDSFDVDGQAEHEQARGQQIAAGHVIQVAAFTCLDDSSGVEDGR